MYKVIKKQGKIVSAYKLGEPNVVLKNLIRDKKIIDLQDGRYEVLSREAINSGSGHGQIACVGDWVRLDSDGFPYPNTNKWFQTNLCHVSGDNYEQIPKPLSAWTADQGMCPEIEFLLKEKGLIINERDPDKFLYAVLWGNPEVAAKDSVLVFYSITYGEKESVQDAEYNFVAKKEFDSIYV